MSSEQNILDQKKLDDYRVESTISGVYLSAWIALVESGKLPRNLDEYLVTFKETENEYLIYFTKRLKEKILGGGSGLFKVEKCTMKISGGLGK